MTLSNIAKRTEKVIADNSPALLTAIGVTGTVTTAFLVGKASFRAADILREEGSKATEDGTMFNKQVREIPLKEKFQLVGKLYIPAVAVGVVTISATIGANRIGTRRAAAMAAAYSISERAFTEYKEKIVEKIGENKEREARDEIAQERVTKNPPGDFVIVTDGKVLCHDAFSGRYFQSTMEELKKAQNDINYQILSQDSASVTDFYNKIGVPPTSHSDEIGWNTDKPLELMFSTVLTEDGKPCLSFDFATVPMREYWRFC